VVDVVDVVGSAGIVLELLVEPALVVLVVVGTGALELVVVGTTVVELVVVGTTPVVLVVVGTVPVELVVVGTVPVELVVLGEDPVVDVVGTVGVVVVLVLVAPGAVVELGSVVAVTVVVVVTPAQLQAVQRPPHGPSPASHSSPPSASHTPSPQRLKAARNGFTIPSDLAVKVAARVRHCSMIVPVRTALPVRPGHAFQRARTFVPFAVARTRAFTGSHPLRTDTMRPEMPTMSGDGASSALASGVPATR